MVNFQKKGKMKTTQGFSLSPTSVPESNTFFYWRIIQLIVWAIGLTVLLLMLLMPPVGVTMFWNILIPVAPALLVIGTGLWRNVCPLATTSLIPDRFDFSKKKKLSNRKRS